MIEQMCSQMENERQNLEKSKGQLVDDQLALQTQQTVYLQDVRSLEAERAKLAEERAAFEAIRAEHERLRNAMEERLRSDLHNELGDIQKLRDQVIDERRQLECEKELFRKNRDELEEEKNTIVEFIRKRLGTSASSVTSERQM